jgi:hypothetical protein
VQCGKRNMKKREKKKARHCRAFFKNINSIILQD